MDLIPISNNVMINVDLIEAIEVVDSGKNKEFIIISGGKRYAVEIDKKKLLSLLLKRGSSNKNQFFAG